MTSMLNISDMYFPLRWMTSKFMNRPLKLNCVLTLAVRKLTTLLLVCFFSYSTHGFLVVDIILFIKISFIKSIDNNFQC